MSKAYASVRPFQPRESSPRADEYHTGYSDFNSRELLHSTEHLQLTDQDQIAKHWTLDQDMAGGDDDGSASMSIEYGRGLKRAGSELDDLSSNAAFPIGENSEYEVTKTPPLNILARKKDAGLREVSLRRANEGAKRTTNHSAKTAASLADVLRSNKMVEDTTETHEITVNAKNTRFTHKKVVQVRAMSGQVTTPQATRVAPISTIDTGDFLLPDVSNIDDLIAPVIRNSNSRFTNKKNSRFTPSATHRMPVRFEGADRVPVQSVPIPEDEKKIYAALQNLQEKFNQLEFANAEAGRQLDQYEKENIELRNAVIRGEQLERPDSALSSEDETGTGRWRFDRTKLQSSLRSVQQRYDKIEQKLKVREGDLRACTKERDDLITQLGVECYRLQELEGENAQLRQDHDALQVEVSSLRQELQALRTPARPTAKDITGTFSRRDNAKRSSRYTATKRTPISEDSIAARNHCINFDVFDAQARQQIANVVKQQWQNQQDRLRSSSQHTGGHLQSTMFDIISKPVKTVRSSAPSSRRQQKVVAEDEDDEEDAYTDFEITNTKNMTGRSLEGVEANDDVTELTANDPAEVMKLRQFLEEQRQAMHLKRHSSAPAVPQQTPAQPVNRRSSLRDLTGNIASDFKRTVRVQSPAAEDRRAADDDTQTSLVSNVGRRRSNAAQDGETSAFIIPDITLHRKAPLHTFDGKHDAQACTVCTQIDADMSIPMIIPISTRTNMPDDSTIRPSQPPRDALARVLKQLNDELSHLKLALAGYQKQHNSNDPSIGARARKQLYDKISEIMAQCKRKEDQIYALYDAAEGQLVVSQEPKSVKERISTPAAKKTFNFVAEATAPHALGLDGTYDDHSDAESVGLPAWEGLSEIED